MRIPEKSRNRSLASRLLAGAACILSVACIAGCLNDVGEDAAKDSDKIKADSLAQADSLKTAQALADSLKKADSLKAAQPFLFALTSDRKTTGSYASVTLGGTVMKKNIAAVHSDAVVKYFGGNDIFVVNRFGRDNIQVVSRDSLKTVLQFSLPSGSNPQDVALKDSTLYVGMYAYAKIGIFNQFDGKSKGELDLSAYADTSDKLPETAALLIYGNDLYVLLQNLDTKTYAPLQARLVRFNLVTEEVKALDLPFGNPLSLALDTASKKLYIPCVGKYTNDDWSPKLDDGGVISVDVASFTVSDTLITEDALKGTVNKALFLDGKLYMSVSEAAKDKVISLEPRKGATPVELAATGSYKLASLALDGVSKTLYIADRDAGAGLRLIDLATGKERDSTKIDLGLAPNDLAVIR